MPGSRVAITGCGVVSPVGIGLEAFRSALLDARSGIRRLPEDLAQRSGVPVAGAIDWDPSPWFAKASEASQLDRGAQFAVAAAAQAIDISGLDPAARDLARIGVTWGTGMGGASTLEVANARIYARNDLRLRPMTVVMGMANAPGSNVALRWKLKGPFANYSTACSSSAMALGEAMRFILSGRADAMVAGGSEALLTPAVLAAWNAVRTLAPVDADDPAASCKPFDRRRGGLVLAEGGAAFVLESETSARARAAQTCWRGSRDTAIRATRNIFRAPTARDRCARCARRLRSPACPPTTSATSTRTAPRPRSATSWNARRSAKCSAPTPIACW
jgi:3-oxoacyl-[acyl-carrier-protein] synthase II